MIDAFERLSLLLPFKSKGVYALGKIDYVSRKKEGCLLQRVLKLLEASLRNSF